MHVRPFEVCQLMKVGTTNLFTKFLFEMVEDSAPGIIHACPYKKFNITNAMVKTSTVGSPFATGDYKGLFVITDAENKHMVTFLIVGSVNSSDKNSFG